MGSLLCVSPLISERSFTCLHLLTLKLKSSIRCLIILGTPGLTFSVEKFTKYDNEKRMKEAEVIEGGYLDLGFTLYRVRFEIIEKGIGSCIIRSTIEYDVKDDFAANASLVTVQLFADIAQVAAQHLTKQE